MTCEARNQANTASIPSFPFSSIKFVEGPLWKSHQWPEPSYIVFVELCEHIRSQHASSPELTIFARLWVLCSLIFNYFQYVKSF
jgi:hypothetical protein